METFKGFKVRIYPTEVQKENFLRYCGASRFAYNLYLRFRIKYYKLTGKTLSAFTFSKHFTKMKKRKKYKWCSEIADKVCKIAFQDVEKAYDRFFKGTAGFPRFKTRKTSRLSFGCRDDQIKLTARGLNAYSRKLGWVKFKGRLPEKISNPRISFDNKYWYLSYGTVIETQETNHSGSVGIDLGLKDLATLSNGNVIQNPNKSSEMNRLERRKKILQRRLSRKIEANIVGYKSNRKPIWKKPLKECRNIQKLMEKICLVERRMSNIRLNACHELTKSVIAYESVGIEFLKVKNLMKNKHLSRSVGRAMWYEIRRQLEYKSKMYGFELKTASPYFPSTQTCSNCGNVKKGKEKLKLRHRTYTCGCGHSMDRDLNAAINLSRL